jgi:hypothetical protein
MAAAETIPSHIRCVPGSVNIPVAKFPVAAKVAEQDANKVAANFIETFNNALSKGDYVTLSNFFGEDGFWRDHLALSWNFRTVRGPKDVLAFLKESASSKDGFRLKSIAIDSSTATRAPQVTPVDGGTAGVDGVQFFFNLETTIGAGIGLVRLVEDGGAWKVFTLYTSLRELKGHEEVINHRRGNGVEHGGKPGRQNWAERRAAAADYEDGSEPSVLIIGMWTCSISHELPWTAGSNDAYITNLLTIPRCRTSWTHSSRKTQDVECQHPRCRPK